MLAKIVMSLGILCFANGCSYFQKIFTSDVKDDKALIRCKLELSAQQLMEQMLSSPQFLSHYNTEKNAKGRLPVIVIGNIENKMNEHVQEWLDVVGDVVRVTLSNSSLFVVKNDDKITKQSRTTPNSDNKVENGTLVQEMETRDPPDYIVLGDLRHFSEVDGSHTYRLRLALHSLKTGKIVWEGIQMMVKR